MSPIGRNDSKDLVSFLSWTPPQQCLILVLRREQCQWSWTVLEPPCFPCPRKLIALQQERTKPALLVAHTCLSPSHPSAQNVLLLHACVVGIVPDGPQDSHSPVCMPGTTPFSGGIGGPYLIRSEIEILKKFKAMKTPPVFVFCFVFNTI